METVSLNPICCMRTCFKTKNGTPRQPSISSSTRGQLTIDKSIFTNPEHSLDGLEEFAYVWVLFSFHLNQNKGVKAKVRPPRLDGAKRGVFATRSPHRPNPIGLTLAKLEKVNGSTLTLSGLDIVDGTPILDIKPYIKQYDFPSETDSETESDNSNVETCVKSDQATRKRDNTEKVESSESNEPSSMKSTLPDLIVVFTCRAEADLSIYSKGNKLDVTSEYRLEHISNAEDLRSSIEDILKADPRSTYRRNKCCDRLYYFLIDNCHVTAWFDYSTFPNTAEVLRVKPESKIVSSS
ncbi:tRNA (adenine(37)-N6)-methyltransferase-like [Styela clava]|uniref:tRNA (adenine(37)-N6)-methyltransferase-like n=1 Tax=Styela clava TaxID=7725 RepID=UPI00193980E0|nr:tRNA (adenine(37)-N6)-methyltransferase-like [Styela clava]